MRTIFLILFLTSLNSVQAQKMPVLPSDTLIIGPQKYLSEIIRITGKYAHIGDSLFKLHHSPGYKPENDKNYYNSEGQEGYYMDLSFKELGAIIKQFLDIKRVTGTFCGGCGATKEGYYQVYFDGNGKDLKDGKVRWYIKDADKGK